MIYDLVENETLYWTKTQEPVIKKSMIELCSHILDFLARAACHLKKHPITQTLKDMFNQGEWNVLLFAIKDTEARITNRSRVERWKEVRMIREAQKMNQLAQQTATISKETTARNKKSTAFLRELNEHAWPGGDSDEYSKERVQRAEEATCKWSTNRSKFKAWESPDNPNSGSPLLLLAAYPGSGKSVLSKHLIDTILPKPKDRVVCSIDLTDANSVLAEACISYLYSNFARTDDSLLNYSAIYWADHYHHSLINFQVAAAERTRDLCLLEHCRQWTRIHNKYNRIPIAGPLLCLVSALGLERAAEMILLKQHLISLDFRCTWRPRTRNMVRRHCRELRGTGMTR